MTTSGDLDRLKEYVLGLGPADPFESVYRASHRHRLEHGESCMLHPSDPLTMRLVSVLAGSCHARLLLDIGGGIGYSALHLALAAGADAVVDTIEGEPSHVALAKENVAAAGYDRRIVVHLGRSEQTLLELTGPYDFVYDDGWFMREPAHREPLLERMSIGGLLVNTNWFPLEDAVAGRESPWAAPGNTAWADSVQAYADKLSNHPRLRMAFTLRPFLGMAVKVA
ncbi:MAG TPA: class I SAM-dependent methyltransferase [Dehalococcoidia bacterium]|nr:class I SAM-dependent methyltransferase [Dehalococcoidia bacterium]